MKEHPVPAVGQEMVEGMVCVDQAQPRETQPQRGRIFHRTEVVGVDHIDISFFDDVNQTRQQAQIVTRFFFSMKNRQPQSGDLRPHPFESIALVGKKTQRDAVPRRVSR